VKPLIFSRTRRQKRTE